MVYTCKRNNNVVKHEKTLCASRKDFQVAYIFKIEMD